MDKLEFRETLVRALTEGKDEDFDSLAGAASPDVVFTSFREGDMSGRDAAIAYLRQAQSGGMYARTIEWKKPDAEENPLRVEAVFPITAQPAGFTLDIAFNGEGKVVKIVESMVRPTAPVPPTPIEVTEEMTQAIAGAMDNGIPTVAAYVNEHGQPSISPRGTTQVISKNEIGMWARSGDTGMAKAIESNPNVSIYYSSRAGTPFAGNLQFQGRAHVETNQSVRNRIFDDSPPIEQRADPERKGVAIVVELDRVNGTFARTRYNMVKNVD